LVVIISYQADMNSGVNKPFFNYEFTNNTSQSDLEFTGKG